MRIGKITLALDSPSESCYNTPNHEKGITYAY